MSLFRELRRRKVDRMAVLYLTASWLIMQVAEVLITLGRLPGGLGPIVLSLLVIGFPIAIALSWFYQVSPSGISLEDAGESSLAGGPLAGRRVDFLIIAILCAALIVMAYDRWSIRLPATPAIVVLPFENLSADADQEFFAAGVSEEILTLLGQIPELRVISRASAFEVSNLNLDLPEIGKRLGVTHILDGSIRRSGDTVRITAQLSEAATRRSLWSSTYTQDLDDIFRVQDDIAAAISGSLRLALVAQPERRAPVPEAHIAYLKGRYWLNKRTRLDLAEEYFLEASRIDPEYSLAFSGLADTYFLLAAYNKRPASEMRPKQREAARTAMSLDENSAEAHVSYASGLAIYDWDWAGATVAFEKAIALNPNYSPALHWYASMLALLGDPRHLSMMERAYAVDPIAPRVNVDLAMAHYFNGDYEAALLQLQKTLKMEPDYLGAYPVMGLVLTEMGRYDEALANFEIGANNSLSIFAGYAYARAGRVEEARALQDSWRARYLDGQRGAVPVAMIHAGLGEYDLAFEWLHNAIDRKEGGVTTLLSHAYWQDLRDDSRFDELLARVNLPTTRR